MLLLCWGYSERGRMKFSDSVVMFDYAKFPILGNLATGAVI